MSDKPGWFERFKVAFAKGDRQQPPEQTETPPAVEAGEVRDKAWGDRLKQRLSKTREGLMDQITRLAKGRTKLDDELLEEIEEVLLTADVGVEICEELVEHLRAEAKKRRFLPEEVMPALQERLVAYLAQEHRDLETPPDKLTILLMVGVNGVGKTTTAGKIAARLKGMNVPVMLAAGDTFRAAAIDQLAVWAQRAGIDILHHQEGGDAAAVVYDAIKAAQARGIKVLIVDTAGRLHTKHNLMEELKKVRRIIDREAPGAHVESLLVIDATTGQNGLRQAEAFGGAVGLTGVVLTKLDGTAKGGVVFSVKQTLGLPILLIGVGEGIDDLQPFDPEQFAKALFDALPATA